MILYEGKRIQFTQKREKCGQGTLVVRVNFHPEWNDNSLQIFYTHGMKYRS